MSREAVAYSSSSVGTPSALDPALLQAGLTARQAEVIRLVALGGSNRDIAVQLGVSHRTVQKHLEFAYRRLGVTTRSEAAARAWELAAR